MTTLHAMTACFTAPPPHHYSPALLTLGNLDLISMNTPISAAAIAALMPRERRTVDTDPLWVGLLDPVEAMMGERERERGWGGEDRLKKGVEERAHLPVDKEEGREG